MSRERLAGDLERLAEKYRRLASLRARREEAEAAGWTSFDRDEALERTAIFRELAEEFPGSLREIDSTGAAAFEAKEAAVRAEISELAADPERLAPSRTWIAVTIDYHALMREALAVKRWLSPPPAGAGEVGPDAAAGLRAWLAAWPHRRTDLAEVDDAFLSRRRRPPDGRLEGVVWAEIERRHGVGRREAERMVFGPPVGGEPAC